MHVFLVITGSEREQKAWSATQHQRSTKISAWTWHTEPFIRMEGNVHFTRRYFPWSTWPLISHVIIHGHMTYHTNYKYEKLSGSQNVTSDWPFVHDRVISRCRRGACLAQASDLHDLLYYICYAWRCRISNTRSLVSQTGSHLRLPMFLCQWSTEPKESTLRLRGLTAHQCRHVGCSPYGPFLQRLSFLGVIDSVISLFARNRY